MSTSPKSKSKSSSKPKRFDHLWHETVVVAYAALVNHARLAARHVAEHRREAYRFASGVMEMQKHHHNALVAMIKSEGRTPQQWMDEHFETIEAMGDTRQRINASIEAGVTEREYVEEGELAIVKRRDKVGSATAKDDGPIPQPSTKPMTPEEKVEHYRDLYDSVVSKYQGVRHELRQTRDALGRTEVRMRKLERTIARLKKDIESLDIVKVSP